MKVTNPQPRDTLCLLPDSLLAGQELQLYWQRIDVIAHVSLSDLQRNADRYTHEAHDQFDKFAPGWRNKVGTDMNQEALRRGIIQYWTDKATELGLPRARHCELITGDHGQRLYWLILLAKHDLAHQLWEKISSAAKAPKFDF